MFRMTPDKSILMNGQKISISLSTRNSKKSVTGSAVSYGLVFAVLYYYLLGLHDCLSY